MNSTDAFDKLWKSLIDVEEYLRSGIRRQLQSADSFGGEDMKPVLEAYQTFRHVYPDLTPELREDAEDLFDRLEDNLNEFLDSLGQATAIPKSDSQSRRAAKKDAIRILDNAFQQHRQLTNNLAQKKTSNIVSQKSKGKDAYDAFICHASEDKDELVRPLVGKLEDKGFEIWYDEFEITIGDSIRRSIDKGLTQSRFGIVVLSEAFFEKDWPQAELDALVAQEQAIEEDKVILPIWHNVEKDDVQEFSPILASKLAISSESMSINKLTSNLEQVFSKQ